MKHSSSNLDRVIQRVSGNDRLRVWSVIITLFGDAVVPRGGTIGMSALQAIMGGMNIEPNAVRTAMSRLASDGWVKRERSGRQSFYSLAPEGLALFEEASQRIYNLGTSEWRGTFETVLRPADDHRNRSQFQKRMRELGFGSPMQDVYVRPELTSNAVLPEDLESMVLRGGKPSNVSLAEFVARSWPVEQLSDQYQSILDNFSEVMNIEEDELAANEFKSLIVRILLVHQWRKLVLRDADLPDEFRSKNHAGVQARALVSDVYKRLFVPSELFLDQCERAPEQFLPPPDSRVSLRFK